MMPMMVAGGGSVSSGVGGGGGIPGWHAMRAAVMQVLGPRMNGSGRDISRKLSGEGLPLVSTATVAQQRRQPHSTL